MLKLQKLTDADYHSVGGFNLQNPKSSVISASLLKEVYDRGLYETIISPKEIDSNLEEISKIGTLVHLAILEPSEFEKRYYIGDIDPLETRERIEPKIGEMIQAFRDEISLKYPFLADEVGAELAILGDLDGVQVKAKLDKFTIARSGYIDIYDVKTTQLPMEKVKRDRSGRLWEIDRTIDEYHIDLQMYFYSRLVSELFAQKGQYYEARCYILFCSKTDLHTRLIQLSPEIIGRGEEKFGRIWDDVKEFVGSGLSVVNKALIL